MPSPSNSDKGSIRGQQGGSSQLTGEGSTRSYGPYRPRDASPLTRKESIDTVKADLKKIPAVKTCFLNNGCIHVRSSNDPKHREHIFSVTLSDRRCQLWIQKSWMRLDTQAKIDERLDRLEVIPFMQHNSLAWIGLEVCKEVIQHIPGRCNPLLRQHKATASNLKKLLDSRIPIVNGRVPA